jgi:hypothetical protein
MICRRFFRVAGPLAAVSSLWLGLVCHIVGGQQAQAQSAAETPEPGQLTITNDGSLPDAFLHTGYQVQLIATGSVGPPRWELTKGTNGLIPPGIKLERNGLLHGAAERAGEYQFTLSVFDNAQPPHEVRKMFTIRVPSALTLSWKSIAHVNGNRIEGSAGVSNTTPDDIDLTFIVLAVAANGRATAIGYQHFNLSTGTIGMELPFGETLPPGAYVVHVDAVGEVAAKNVIYRERLQTPKALQVTVGP